MNLTLNTFFNKLSYRAYKENDLSDITWALCESCPVFKELFISFFFAQEKLNYETIKLHREYSVNGKRPDFWFEHSGRKFAIEVKINDTNHHFDDFEELLQDVSIGYIANYRITHNRSFRIRTWKDFKNHLEVHFPENHLAKKLVDAYIVYLNSVCNIINYKKMELSQLVSLFQFNRLIKDIILSYTDNTHIISLNNQPANYGETFSGSSFWIENVATNKFYSFWYGIMYGGKVVIAITLSVNEYNKLLKYSDVSMLQISEGIYADKMYLEEGNYHFDMQENIFSELSHVNTTQERQKELLENFFREVVNSIKNYV